MEGNEDQNPVHEANKNDHHEERIRNLPLKNLERGPAARTDTYLVPPVEQSLPKKRNVKKEILSN